MPADPAPSGSARAFLLAGVVAAGVARLADAVAASRVRGWQRTNFRGRIVSLGAGVGAAAGALTAASLPGPYRRAALIAGGAAALAGGYDDLLAPHAEADGDKGLRGHLAAAGGRRLSGGVVKVAVVGSAAVLSSRLLPGSGRIVHRAVSATLIAGSANLLNLFDLRPGRAGKLATGASALGLFGPAAGIAAAAGGSAAATLPADLGERSMLGDIGSNTLGAMLGVRLAAGSPGLRGAALVVIVGLTTASERTSFSKVIDSVPALRRIDELGRSRAPERRR
ncbi:MAG: hypothetical protein ABJB98_07730 [Actinomycetota bacterium]